MILLPLKSDLGDISRALGVVVSDCATGGVPNRFDVMTSAFRPVSGLRYEAVPGTGLSAAPFPEADLTDDRAVSLPGFAEPRATLRGRGRHLRLVK